MTVYLANFGSDENKKYRGGKAGDQTGLEGKIIPWYDGNWIFVARYNKNANVRELIATYAKNAAMNDHIGYDQSERTTYWNYLNKAKDFNPANITTNCETDCSAFTAATIKAVGNYYGIKELMNVSENMWTGNEKNVLSNAGFTMYASSAYVSNSNLLHNGDVIFSNSHSVIVCSGGVATINASNIVKADETTAYLTSFATRVIAGEFGNGSNRKDKLYTTVQKRVNEILNGSKISTDAVDMFATDVINGKYGNGTARKENIYKAVQNRVNEIL